MDALWLIPALPLLGALLLAILGGILPRRAAGALGCAAVGISWLVSLSVAWEYLAGRPESGAFRQPIYEWLHAGPLQVTLGLYLDQLSLVMVSVVTFVGFLIHLYSAEFMAREQGYSRFFCYLNLFVASMLLLLLGDSLLSLYLGWEGVGLCSYLLIGFRYRQRANGLAAQKAFIVTRIGDTALAIGLFLLFQRFGTLDIQEIMQGFGAAGPELKAFALTASLLVLGGAVGKSAQIPLQTWLPDAMAGPSPVSALIHAATMVTAGVYLIARTQAMFAAAPPAMLTVAVIGAATCLTAAVSALAQHDLKRILAYSTISQIGYMFLALGVGAWWAAIFHFLTHAFFKALLFLSAGAVIQSLDEEHDIHRMGGLWRRLPVAAWTFLVGAASLSALPLVTAGFYSKEAILAAAWSSSAGSPALWAIGVLTALLTALYSFRAFFFVFTGEQHTPLAHRPGVLENIPMAVLAAGSIAAGAFGVPRALGGTEWLAGFLRGTSAAGAIEHLHAPAVVTLVPSAAALLGVVLSWLLFIRLRQWSPAFAQTRSYGAWREFFRSGWGFDRLYGRLLVQPLMTLAIASSADLLDRIYVAIASLAAVGNRLLSSAQTGRIRDCATGILLGAVLIIAALLLR